MSSTEFSLSANEAGDVPQLAVPRLSVCADAQKVDRAKLSQTEVGDQIHSYQVG